jgi:alkanesulfonate monooxygenase SsuD/methylene tetrahydromethanopterin reductase-like flavin-dependent oxidoreductase (luciferase family)
VTTLGVVFRPQVPPEQLRATVTVAEASGLAELWLWEDCFRESGVATMAAALAWSDRLRVGIGLLPVPLRNVALTAMELATLARLFPGRPRIGLGHGVQDWMAQVGQKVASPLTLTREYVIALRALLAGERVSTEGRYVRLRDVALDWPPDQPPAAPPALLLGATGPKSLDLAGGVADGTIITGGTTVDGLRAAAQRLDRAALAAGRPAPHPIVVYLMTATGPDANERMARELAAWSLPADQDLAVAGGAEEIAAAVRRFADAGAGTVVLQPTADEPDLNGLIDFAAREVAPLLG